MRPQSPKIPEEDPLRADALGNGSDGSPSSSRTILDEESLQYQAVGTHSPDKSDFVDIDLSLDDSDAKRPEYPYDEDSILVESSSPRVRFIEPTKPGFGKSLRRAVSQIARQQLDTAVDSFSDMSTRVLSNAEGSDAEPYSTDEGLEMQMLQRSESHGEPEFSTQQQPSPDPDISNPARPSVKRSKSLRRQVRLEGNSLGIFSPSSRIRLFCARIIRSKVMEPLVTLLIFIQAAFILIDNAPNVYDLEQKKKEFTIINEVSLVTVFFTFAIFTVELLIKIIALGLIFDSDSESKNLKEWFCNTFRRLRSIFVEIEPTNADTQNRAPVYKLYRRRRAALDTWVASKRAVSSWSFAPTIRKMPLDDFQSRAFLRHTLNRMDLIAVLSYWIDVALFYSNGNNEARKLFVVLTTLRVARLLALTHGTWMILHSLKRGSRSLLSISAITLFGMIIFAIIGMQLFRQSFERTCFWMDTSMNLSSAVDTSMLCGSTSLQNGTIAPYFVNTTDSGLVYANSEPFGYACQYPTACIRNPGHVFETITSYKHFGWSLLQVVIIASFNGWSDGMFELVASEPMSRSIFYLVAVIVLYYWLINMFVAVITTTYSSMQQKPTHSRAASVFNTILAQKHVASDTPYPLKSGLMKISRWLRGFYERYLRVAFMGVEIFEISVLSQWYYSGPDPGQNPLSYNNGVQNIAAFLFVIEIAFRFFLTYMFEWRLFWKSKINVLDLVLAIASLIIIIPEIRESSAPSAHKWLLFIPLMRFYRVICAERHIRQIVYSMYRMIFSVLNALLFVLMCNAMAAIMAVDLLRGFIPPGPSNLMNFYQSFNSYLAMYQLYSSENWTTVLSTVMGSVPTTFLVVISAILLCLWMYFGYFILLQLFVAVINETFDIDDSTKKAAQLCDYFPRVYRSLKFASRTSNKRTHTMTGSERVISALVFFVTLRWVPYLSDLVPYDEVPLTELKVLKPRPCTIDATPQSRYESFASLYSRTNAELRAIEAEGESGKYRPISLNQGDSEDTVIPNQEEEFTYIPPKKTLKSEILGAFFDPEVFASPSKESSQMHMPFTRETQPTYALSLRTSMGSRFSSKGNDGTSILYGNEDLVSSPTSTMSQAFSKSDTDDLAIPQSRSSKKQFSVKSSLSYASRSMSSAKTWLLSSYFETERETGVPFYRQDRTLLLFPQGSLLRKFCQSCVAPVKPRRHGQQPVLWMNAILTGIVLLTVVASIIVAIGGAPVYMEQSFYERLALKKKGLPWNVKADLVIVIVFYIELAMKLVADGAFFGENAHFRSLWNIFDHAVLVCILINVVLGFQIYEYEARWVRILKGIRPLRLLTLILPMRQYVDELIVRGIMNIAASLLLIFLYIIPFSTWGQRLFTSMLYQCTDGPVTGKYQCTGEALETVLSDWEYPVPRRWQNPPGYSFDSFGKSFLILFEIMSLEGWTSVLGSLMQIKGYDIQPQQNASQWYSLYLLAYNLLGSTLVLTVFVTVIVRAFLRRSGNLFYTVPQRHWRALKAFISTQGPSRRPKVGDEPRAGTLRRRCFDLCDAKKVAWWQYLVQLLLVIQLIVLAVTGSMDSLAANLIVSGFIIVISGTILLESAVEAIGYGPWLFIRYGWGLFTSTASLGSVVSSVAAIIVLLIDENGTEQNKVLLTRDIFGIILVLKIAHVNDYMNGLLKVAINSLPALLKVFAIWGVLFLMYIISFMEAFSLTRWGSHESMSLNYNGFSRTLLMLIRQSTGEGWNSHMHDYMVNFPKCLSAGQEFFRSDCGSPGWALFLFISWNILSMYLMSNLVLGAIIDNFWYVYQGQTGRGITRKELRGVKRAWSLIDVERRGELSLDQILPFLVSLRGTFQFSIYEQQRIPELLKKCEMASLSEDSPYEIDLDALAEELDKIDVRMVNARRNVLEQIYAEARMQALIFGGALPYQQMLLLLALHKLVDERDALLVTEVAERQMILKRAEFLRDKERTSSLILMIVQRARFCVHLRRKRQSRELLVSDGDETIPFSDVSGIA